MSCCFANPSSSLRRIMVPSSRMTSQITPAGVRPASLDRSTLASVCPRRSKTPPSFARMGKMCPGMAMLLTVVAGSIMVLIVRARSSAEIPVVTPSTASTDTVNPVPKPLLFWLSGTIIGIFKRSSIEPCIDKHISPRPCVAMKLMAAGVAKSAAMTRSPSFSRSSSSTTTTIFPALMAAMAESTDDRIELFIAIFF